MDVVEYDLKLYEEQLAREDAQDALYDKILEYCHSPNIQQEYLQEHWGLLEEWVEEKYFSDEDEPEPEEDYQDYEHLYP
jgi:hypothetical protein